MPRKRRSVRRKFRLRLKKATVYSITQTVFFGLAGLVLISFARQGIILSKLNDFLVLNFSWATIFLPFVFLSFAFMLSKIKIPLSQPNVVVGSLLFFISISALGRAGRLGRGAWEGISVLVTPAGSFIILLGTLITGLIILFNTSFDQVWKILKNIVDRVGFYVKGDKRFRKTMGRKGLKVSGGTGFSAQKDSLKKGGKSKITKTLTPELVSNVPGEDMVWKYPPLSILGDTQVGKADRGDIKGNAATIEKTLESFGITARVVEVNLGPAVTQYALEVALGTKLSKITALERDLALALAAPTGTISILAGTTSGIEPVYSVAFKRRYLTDGTRWKHEFVVDPTAHTLIEMGINPDKIESAIDLAQDPERRIKFQHDVQAYVDQAISSTINLPAWDTEHNNADLIPQYVGWIQKYAKGLRGLTMYPDGSRGGQPITSIPYEEAINKKDMVFEDNSEEQCLSGVCGI